MKVYLSSTYADLVPYRSRALDVLRNLEFEVLSMETYGASDERPLDRCLADVEKCDLYVGIFAHRYGYIPVDPVRNPDGRSITELEYRCAVDRGIPRLIFLGPGKAKWELEFHDAVTDEGEHGNRIKRLREHLSAERLFASFTSPDGLSAAIAEAAAKWRGRDQVTPARADAPQPREIRFDLLLLHVAADGESAAALAAALPWNVTRSVSGLVASSRAELGELDRQASAARAAAVLLSPAALTVLAEDPHRSRRALDLARDRTGELLTAALAEIPAGAAERWGLAEVVGPAESVSGRGSSLARLLHHELSERLPELQVPLVGLPVVFVAMTADEARDLLTDPPEHVAALLGLAGGTPQSWIDRYGPTRSAWRPFADADESIEQMLSAAVAGVNRDANLLRGRTMRLQSYGLDAVADDLDVWPIYRDIARTGCLVVADELSLFHEGVRGAFATSPLREGEQVALVTLSPFDPSGGDPLAGIRKQLDQYLAQAARRFGEVFDPLCEMGVPERRRLDRWLYRSLPRAVEVLREAKQSPEALRQLSEELGRNPNPRLGRLIAGEGGPA
jgi:hypothetical protein